ncbi:EAL domain, c-di-GMP-specific phosphodiesterase class I (or its enzymatically inactive variant) [Sphingomonas carotinifaciens]|uniref:EAL domain, c-di-GMP-specific phosphodiesterase class I (Or its enzymatically inactive variant) n=1 Tax=Sphingomonas carotinifaciens TaxID=1166323 RepID=A0A1G7S9P8_9SPHN|nr:EAL domain-containing protein [Sphingomonas carotinifaciens]MBB4088209.1 EAL domain-containing protein (putative c-di-GMP-specific phosphodiesterase class I)/GGDEF domain-containing protein [Sphingomonas carotinifaciens]SDG19728.1 EAL domain, c-di-GMP-specific phosphodiesterase class I (or its enzymatically inactive variant) [Sphingomonas carotinifaciens]
MRNYQEEARLTALRQLKLLDTPASESFDRITRMASQIFGLPVAAVSLTDRDRQWFKSRVGIDHCSIPRDKAPCAQVAETTETLVIEDFATSPCYADSVLARAGTRFYAGAPLVTSDGYGLGALCVLGTEPRRVTRSEITALTDLAAMVMAQIELQHAFGRIDPVSGLATQTQFRDDLLDLARDHPGEQRLAVVVDLARDDELSRFRQVMGGARVDDMIREASLALQTALQPARAAYQVGAAQFAFLSPPNVEQDAYLTMVRSTFGTIRAASSVRFVTSVAIGVRPFALGDVSADDVLRGACSAAQDARREDGAIAIFSVANDTAHRRRYRLLQDFGAALEAEDQLRLVYQPRLDLATGRCTSVEALLRWRHPTLGDISPGEFIPIVERTSLARATTQWVLDAALDELAGWQRSGSPLNLSINISASNFGEADLVDRIRQGLLRRKLPPKRLEVELTESAIMDQPDRAMVMLRQLAEAGVCLAIDDFGTGQSSLAYLQRLPAHVIKIDQAFVRGLLSGESSDVMLVETMVDLAHKLNFRVVAEGIETNEAATLLAQIGCEEGQGFLFSRPLEAEELITWLAERATDRPDRTMAA